MTTMTEPDTTTRVFEVLIKAPRETVWDAITSPEWATRYGYQCPLEIELRAGGTYVMHPSEGMLAGGWTSDVVITGDVLEADAPSRFVQTWRTHFGGAIDDEPTTLVTWELEDSADGTRLRVTHELEGAPLQLAAVTNLNAGGAGGGGWTWILNDLKSVLETGKRLAD